jgi:hypothetical protein
MQLEHIKLRILRWEHSVSENPATLVLEIIVVLALVFFGFVLYDAYYRMRRRKNKNRRSQPERKVRMEDEE